MASSTVQTILHVKPNTDFAWPAEGAVDPSIVKVATSAGADKVIARSDSLRETGGLTYTPTAARPIGGGTTAVVADSRLSTAFEGDMAKADNSTLAVQEFLAQSLMVDLQEPSKQRSIVVAPQRMPSVSQAQTMATAVRALQNGNWSDSQNLSAAAKAKPDPSATTKGALDVVPLLAAQAGAAAVGLRGDPAHTEHARQLQGHPHRQVPRGHSLRSGHRPRDVHVLARPCRPGGDLPQGCRVVPGRPHRSRQADRQVRREALGPQCHDPL